MRSVPAKRTWLRISRPFGRGRWSNLALERFVRNRPAVAGLLFLVLIALLALLADVITTVHPDAVDLGAARTPPSPKHLLGTDMLGRDVWSRTLHASRVSLEVGLLAVALQVLIGVSVGAISGAYRGWADSLLLRLADVVMSFPYLLIVLVLVSVVGPGIPQIILVLGAFGWPMIARLVRGQILSIREMEFVTAARAVGVRNLRLILLHLLPSTVGVVAVGATFAVARAILTEASLSFLGAGVQPPSASWGNMLQAARSLAALESMPWLWLSPGLAIFLSILSINFVGDGLRDAFDPRSRQR